MAAGDLTTLTDVRSYLKLPDTQDDSFIEGLITSVSAWVTSETGGVYTAADVTHTFDGDGTDAIELKSFPVVSVASVTVDGETIPKRTDVSGTGWVLDGRFVRLVGYEFEEGVQNVVIAYRAGEAAPADLKHAVNLLVALAYYDRDRLGKASVSVGGESVTYNGGAVKAEAEAIVDRYRPLVFG